MEKIKVNMSPNPLDVQTIHASQNDGEARQWEFELHNNGELIDTSDVKEQLVFKAYKGGTEQILPENTSTPTTSPFKGDIRYPQGLLADQEFTYRQSPTEEDGLAWIKSIKGNTLVWNQLVENGDFASASRWSVNNITTYSVANNILTFSFSKNDGFIGPAGISLTKNHKYLWLMDFKTDLPSPYRENIKIQNYRNGGWSIANRVSNNNWNTYSTIFTFTEDSATVIAPLFRLISYTDGAIDITNSNQIRNVQVFDLTQMGLDITDPSEFTSLFPLSYYAYNQGSLLSFNGNGIKTVGFNQWDEQWEHGSLGNNGENTGSSSAPEIRSVNYIPILQNTAYYLKTPVVTIAHYYGSADLNNYKGNQYLDGAQLLNIPSGTNYIRFRTINTYGDYKNDICLNISDPSRNGQYEPYTSSTLSLPTQQYFPWGMDGVGTAYDELTQTGYVKKIGTLDFGRLTWTWQNNSTYGYWTAQMPRDVKMPSNPNNTPINAIGVSNGMKLNIVGGFQVNGDASMVGRLGVNSGYTIAFNNGSTTDRPNGKVYYELATPTETSFTTASLVTENAEIPLSNEDGTLIGKCTEELSAEPGFHDAKIKLSDADGECYSNKIQLHVERSPQ